MKAFVMRHGETAWSVSGRHTSTTDLPLTENGRRLAQKLRPVLAREAFVRVFVSPMLRTRETCELAGLGDASVIDPDLAEWNYGEYEGMTPKQIHEKAPYWLPPRTGQHFLLDTGTLRVLSHTTNFPLLGSGIDPCRLKDEPR